ncbi:hypothetical protein C8J56DRAFT_774778 [Mycena floridula]|nr:hypothetical protein C8J56DRAFT_774778 [Mycena floridula]
MNAVASSSGVVAPSSTSNAVASSSSANIIGPPWPQGPYEIFCHVCRSKSRKQSMECKCGKQFCIRCVLFRFPEKIGFSGCPVCVGNCSCDLCCKKRGEVYVPIRIPKSFAPKAKSVAPKAKGLPKPKPKSKTIPRPLSPMQFREVVGPLHYWGTIYSLSGEALGPAYMGDDRREDVVVTNAVVKSEKKIKQEMVPEPRKRIFVGSIQASWKLGPYPVVRVDEQSADSGESGPVRRYVGAKIPLSMRFLRRGITVYPKEEEAVFNDAEGQAESEKGGGEGEQIEWDLEMTKKTVEPPTPRKDETPSITFSSPLSSPLSSPPSSLDGSLFGDEPEAETLPSNILGSVLAHALSDSMPGDDDL